MAGCQHLAVAERHGIGYPPVDFIGQQPEIGRAKRHLIDDRKAAAGKLQIRGLLYPLAQSRMVIELAAIMGLPENDALSRQRVEVQLGPAPRQQLGQQGFACPVATQDGQPFALFELDIEWAQLKVVRVGRMADGQPLQRDHGHHLQTISSTTSNSNR